MQYLLMANEGADDFAARSDPERSEAYWSSWTDFIGALGAAGVMIAAGGLESPDVATTIRVRSGRRTVEDGPFADSKEHLGGYFLIDVPTVDDALAWAERCPSASSSSVEVRPMLPPMSS